MALVVAVANRKGGSGKTTLAATLAATSASKTLRTVTVDFDSQSNLSRWALGREAVDGLSRVATVLSLEFPVRSEVQEPGSPLMGARTPEELLSRALPLCVHPTKVDGLEIIPCAPHVHPEDSRELLLASLPFDVVIVDTPPDVSSYAVRSVLRQADVVVSPVICDPWAVDATEYLVRELVSVGRADLLENSLVRFVPNMRQKTALADRLEKDLRKVWGVMVSRVVIPRAVAMAEASLGPSILTKKHPLWRVGMQLWSDIESTAKKLEKAA